MPINVSYGITISLPDRCIEGHFEEDGRLFVFAGMGSDQLHIPSESAEEALQTMLDWVRRERDSFIASDPGGERVDAAVELAEGK